MRKKSAPAVNEQQPDVKITSYKGFDKNWKCRGMQYAVGETSVHTGTAKACSAGLHACEYPLDVFSYYAPAESRFAVVEQSGELSRHQDDSKVASTKLHVKAELDIAGLVKAAIDYTFSRVKPAEGNSNSGDYGASTNSGDYGAATNSGNYGAATNSGNYGASTNSGDYGAATNSGNYGTSRTSGKAACAANFAEGGKVMGTLGCAIFTVLRDDTGEIVHARAGVIGRDGLKPDVWYVLDAAGEFAEAQS